MGVSRRGQFQERNHLFLQLDRSQFQHGIERGGVRDVEFAGDAAAERREVCPAAEFLTEIVRHAADVRAFGASELERAEWLGVVGETEVVARTKTFS